MWSHFNDFGIEPSEDVDEVGLGGHDLVDILVNAGDLVEPSGDEFHAALFQYPVDLTPFEGLEGFGPAHDTARAMGGRQQRVNVALAAHEISRRRHRPGDDAEDTFAGGSGAFAMDNDITVDAGDAVAFFPGEVVVVFDVQQNLEVQVAGDMPMDEGMIGGRVTPHQFHGRPILEAGVGVECEPGEVFVFFGQFRVLVHGKVAVMGANGGAGAAAAAVAEQGHVLAGRKSADGVSGGKDAELDEMIAAAAGAELCPGAILVLAGDGADGPVRFEDLVFTTMLEGCAHTEAGLGFDGFDELLALSVQLTQRQIEDGEFHAAGDVDADGIGDHRVVGGEHTADGQAITDMGVRHEGARHRDRELAGPAHLVDGLGFEILSPLAPGRRRHAQRAFRAQQRLGKLTAQCVVDEGVGVANHGFEVGGEFGLVEPLEDVTGDELDAAPGGFAGRDTQSDEVFGIHEAVGTDGDESMSGVGPVRQPQAGGRRGRNIWCQVRLAGGVGCTILKLSANLREDKNRRMHTATDSSLQTRKSLLSRLRDLDDHESWREFFELYWRLIFNVARRSGLNEDAAEEVVQETVISVARRMPGFDYDSSRGSFKQWLLRITRRRIMDHLRRVYRRLPSAGVAPETIEGDEDRAVGVTDPVFGQIESSWEEEWKQTIFDAAVASVRREANPKQFQVFDLCVLKGWPVSRVTATLGLNAAQVYLAKHRVAQAVKRAGRRINESHSRE